LFIAAVLVQPDIAEAQSSNTILLNSINTQRTIRGLSGLQVNDEMTVLAQQWSEVLAEEKNLKHSALSVGVTQNWRKLGENVGSGGSAQAVATALIASPSHLQNIIDPEFTGVGIGITVSENTLYVVQKFISLTEEIIAKPIPTLPPSTTLPPVVPPTTILVETPIQIEPAVPTTTSTVVPEAPKVVSDVERGSFWKTIKSLIAKALSFWKTRS